MKLRTFALMAAVLVISALFVACSGDDDDAGPDNDGSTGNVDPSAIRTEKGLAVAAAGQQLGLSFGAESDDALFSGGGGGGLAGKQELAAPAAADGAARLAGDAYGLSFAPALQEGGAAGLTVQGYGSATAAADQGVIEMSFYRDGYIDRPFPEDGGGDSVEPITEDDLAAVVAALEGFGAGVEFVNQNYYYRDPYYSNVTLRATMSDLDAIEEAIDAANNAADGLDDVEAGGASTYFSLSDCSAMEQAAMEAAVEDAEERGDVLAGVLGVSRGAVTGASNYSYSPYGNGSCSSSYYYGPFYGAEEQPGPTDVVVFANVAVTYAIE